MAANELSPPSKDALSFNVDTTDASRDNLRGKDTVTRLYLLEISRGLS